MSTAELTATPDGGALAAGDRAPAGVRQWFRLLSSELRLIFRRWRNLALLAVLVVLPVVLGIGLKVAGRAAVAGAGRRRHSSPSSPGTACSSRSSR